MATTGKSYAYISRDRRAIEELMKIVGKHLLLTPEELTSRSRAPKLVLFRQLLVSLAYNQCFVSINSIAKALKMHHTTIGHGIDKIALLRAQRADIEIMYQKLIVLVDQTIRQPSPMPVSLNMFPPHPVRRLSAAVAIHLGLLPEDLYRKRHTPALTTARHLVATLSRQEFFFSLPTIGRSMEIHHSSVLYSVKRITALRAEKPEMENTYQELAAIAHRLDLSLTLPAGLMPEPPQSVALPSATSCPAPASELAKRRHLEIAKQFPFEALDRPSAGTACVWCQELGHWCSAGGFCGDHAVCVACGRGQACNQALAQASLKPESDYAWSDYRRRA